MSGSGMTNEVRRVLYEAGFTEARGESLWGFTATIGTTPDVVRVGYIRAKDPSRREATIRFGNEQVSKYVRALQDNGFRVSRVNGVTDVDKLMVLRAVEASTI